MTSPEGISRVSPLLNETLLNETSLNTPTEDKEEEYDLTRDAARINAHKSDLQEARHAIEVATKNLPEQEKTYTADVLIEFLNPHIGKFCNELNSKHLKLTKQIAYFDRGVKKHTDIFTATEQVSTETT